MVQTSNGQKYSGGCNSFNEYFLFQNTICCVLKSFEGHLAYQKQV